MGSTHFSNTKKDATVWFISDFRELNKRIKQKPYPSQEIKTYCCWNLKVSSMQWHLILNMGYYHIKLSPFSKCLCTVVMPYGKYEYQHLPMGPCNSPDIFWERMYAIFSDLEYIRVYIDDLLVISCSTFEEHLQRLKLVFSWLSKWNGTHGKCKQVSLCSIWDWISWILDY